MRLYFWLLVLVLAIGSQDDEDKPIFQHRIEFFANAKARGGPKTCLRLSANVRITLDGNANTIQLSQLHVHILDDDTDLWKAGLFDSNVEAILGLKAKFTITKKGTIKFQTKEFHHDEAEWSKRLKREILNLFLFEVDKNEDGNTEIKLNLDASNDFQTSKITIPDYKTPFTADPNDGGRRLRQQCTKPNYKELPSKIGDDSLMVLKQYETIKDPLKKRRQKAQKDYNMDAELSCRPFLAQFAKEYDNKDYPSTDFGDNSLDIIAQTYNEYRHQRSTFYVYFLMRESVIKRFGKKLTFQQFLLSIFYIGKGMGTRVFQHLKEAREQKNFGHVGRDPDSDSDAEPETTDPTNSNIRTKRALDEDDDEDALAGNTDFNKLPETEEATSEEKNAKFAAILDEWSHNYGIICYKPTVDILSAEAFTLEAIGIEGYGNLKHGGSLTNVVRGHYGSHNVKFGEWFRSDGAQTSGTTDAERIAAVYFLNAYEAFKRQRHRPIYAHDVRHMKI